jgi:hypothetical protein
MAFLKIKKKKKKNDSFDVRKRKKKKKKDFINEIYLSSFFSSEYILRIHLVLMSLEWHKTNKIKFIYLSLIVHVFKNLRGHYSFYIIYKI